METETEMFILLHQNNGLAGVLVPIRPETDFKKTLGEHFGPVQTIFLDLHKWAQSVHLPIPPVLTVSCSPLSELVDVGACVYKADDKLECILEGLEKVLTPHMLWTLCSTALPFCSYPAHAGLIAIVMLDYKS
jgi:hypothetical protein